MRTRIKYDGKTYGNEEESLNYKVSASGHEAAFGQIVNVNIDYNDVPWANPDTQSLGKVKGLHLYMSSEAARALATTILAAVELPTSKASVEIDESLMRERL